MLFTKKQLAAIAPLTIPYSDKTRLRVSHAMTYWKEFCRSSSSEKQFLASVDRNNDDGYSLRTGTLATEDHKELFHFSQAFFNRLAESGRMQNMVDGRTRNFLYAAGALIENMAPMVMRFANDVQWALDAQSFSHEVSVSKPHWTLRFLHYLPTSASRDIIAHPHPDRGGFSLHLNESSPGLEYLDELGEWHAMPMSHEATVLFPGMGLQYRTANRMRALCHRVVGTPGTTGERYSMVAFIPLMQTPYCDAAKVPRLQDLPHGFNYTISLKDLEKMFSPR